MEKVYSYEKRIIFFHTAWYHVARDTRRRIVISSPKDEATCSVKSVNFHQTTQCHIPESSYVCIYMLFSNIAISHMVKIKGNEQFMYLLLHHSKNRFCRLLESDDGRQRDNRVHEVNTAERGRWKGSSEWSSWWGMHYGVFKGWDVGSFFRCCRKGPRVLHPLGHLSVTTLCVKSTAAEYKDAEKACQSAW